MGKFYKTPQVILVKIQMEADIAACSARVYPYDDRGYVQEEWIQESDDNRNIDW